MRMHALDAGSEWGRWMNRGSACPPLMRTGRSLAKQAPRADCSSHTVLRNDLQDHLGGCRQPDCDSELF